MTVRIGRRAADRLDQPLLLVLEEVVAVEEVGVPEDVREEDGVRLRRIEPELGRQLVPAAAARVLVQPPAEQVDGAVPNLELFLELSFHRRRPRPRLDFLPGRSAERARMDPARPGRVALEDECIVGVAADELDDVQVTGKRRLEDRAVAGVASLVEHDHCRVELVQHALGQERELHRLRNKPAHERLRRRVVEGDRAVEQPARDRRQRVLTNVHIAIVQLLQLLHCQVTRHQRGRVLPGPLDETSIGEVLELDDLETERLVVAGGDAADGAPGEHGRP